MVGGIILIALFSVCMLLWAFAAFGGESAPVKNSAALAWLAVLFLGMLVLLSGFGWIVWKTT